MHNYMGQSTDGRSRSAVTVYPLSLAILTTEEKEGPPAEAVEKLLKI